MNTIESIMRQLVTLLDNPSVYSEDEYNALQAAYDALYCVHSCDGCTE